MCSPWFKSFKINFGRQEELACSFFSSVTFSQWAETLELAAIATKVHPCSSVQEAATRLCPRKLLMTCQTKRSRRTWVERYQSSLVDFVAVKTLPYSPSRSFVSGRERFEQHGLSQHGAWAGWNGRSRPAGMGKWPSGPNSRSRKSWN